jgi:hypothetical protein
MTCGLGLPSVQSRAMDAYLATDASDTINYHFVGCSRVAGMILGLNPSATLVISKQEVAIFARKIVTFARSVVGMVVTRSMLGLWSKRNGHRWNVW